MESVLDGQTLGLAIGLVLLIEGFMPLVSPATWRQTFQQILRLNDGQLRFFGLLSFLLGALLMLWLA